MSPERPHAGEVSGASRMRAASERMILMRTFGQKLRQLRLAARMPPGRLAHKCRVSLATISNREGGRSESSLSLILILCDGLGVSPDTLIGDLPTLQERRSK